MLEYLVIIGPILISLLIYFIRLERRFTRIETNLEWIAKIINSCPRP